MKPNIEKLKEFLKLMSDSLTREEFTVAINQLIVFLKKAEENLGNKIDAKTEQAVNDLKELQQEFSQEFSKIIDDARNESDSTLAGFKRKTIETINSLFIKSRIKERIAEIDNKLAEFNAYNLPNASEVAAEASKLASETLLPLIPTIPNTKEEISKLGDIIATSLENLPEDEKLKVEAIKGLTELLDELKSRPVKVGGGGTSDLGVTMSLSRIIRTETPTGNINGVNKTYTVSTTINAILSFSINGMVISDNEYTYSGSTITFTTAIPADLTGTNFRIKFI